ncbi:hypothetical protein BC829DRAFT_50956 [Chytridium lagenaria]|nr:hypothetical protein BC829DRAFT_50956 [Chytridium lagenaria]
MQQVASAGEMDDISAPDPPDGIRRRKPSGMSPSKLQTIHLLPSSLTTPHFDTPTSILASKNRANPQPRPVEALNPAPQQPQKGRRRILLHFIVVEFQAPIFVHGEGVPYLRLYISILSRLISDPLDDVQTTVSVGIAWVACIWAVFVCVGGVLLGNVASLVMMVTMPRITLPLPPLRPSGDSSRPFKFSIIIPSLNDASCIVGLSYRPGKPW